MNGLLFAATRDRRIRFTKPISVTLYREGGVYIALSEEVQEFGIGHSRSEALDDLGKTIAESFLSLNEMESQLGIDLQIHREQLGRYVELHR